MNNNYTPRSNAAIVYDCVENMHIADVARQLERELNEANKNLELVTKQRDDAWLVAEHRERNIKYENSLKQQLEESQKECLEQARLNGMGAEREAKLLSTLQSILDKIPCSYIPNHTIDRLPTIVEGLVEEVSYLSKEYDRLTDILEANGIEYPED